MGRKRSPPSITLLQLLIVSLLLSLLGAFLVAHVATSRRVAEVRTVAALNQLASVERYWRETDSDKNGAQDYWTLDVAGLYGVNDWSYTPYRYIDAQVAAADAAPALPYQGISSREERAPYRVRVMALDDTGSPYVDPTMAPAGVTPVLGMRCTHHEKFAFCAWPVGRWEGERVVFIINEKGVVYRADDPGTLPVTTWPAAIGRTDHLPVLPPWKAAE